LGFTIRAVRRQAVRITSSNDVSGVGTTGRSVPVAPRTTAAGIVIPLRGVGLRDGDDDDSQD
jgi:hypothetical protein